jgi:transposase
MITTMHSDQNASPPRVEVITSVQRRRRWPTAEKIRLVEETMQPGMSVSYVARRAGVAPSLLFNWRRRMLEGGLQAVRADDARLEQRARGTSRTQSCRSSIRTP